MLIYALNEGNAYGQARKKEGKFPCVEGEIVSNGLRTACYANFEKQSVNLSAVFDSPGSNERNQFSQHVGRLDFFRITHCGIVSMPQQGYKTLLSTTLGNAKCAALRWSSNQSRSFDWLAELEWSHVRRPPDSTEAARQTMPISAFVTRVQYGY